MFFKRIFYFIFILFLFAVSCEPNSKAVKSNACINRIMDTDAQLGKKRNTDCLQNSISSSIENYVMELTKLDFSQCPTEFKKAFDAHRSAWVAMTVVTNRYPDLRGEMHQLFEQMNSGTDSVAFKALEKAIWDSWESVEREVNKYNQ